MQILPSIFSPLLLVKTNLPTSSVQKINLLFYDNKVSCYLKYKHSVANFRNGRSSVCVKKITLLFNPDTNLLRTIPFQDRLHRQWSLLRSGGLEPWPCLRLRLLPLPPRWNHLGVQATYDQLGAILFRRLIVLRFSPEKKRIGYL